MDQGAHFHKCDFQVHTPRDIQWTGRRFGVNSDQVSGLSDEDKETIKADRIQFAKEYLQKARNKGLNAIAITDHHDVAFVKAIRTASLIENQQFIAANNSEKCISVFPGIELTLVNPNCQVLIIFDADFPDIHLDSVIALLGINPSSDYDKQTALTIRIPQEHIQNLNTLHSRLDETNYCKGRYIILPNLNDGGGSTLLRTGAHDHYVKMPCVGGYVDKALSTDSGWINKTNGGDVNYGNKAVGIVSTSDNRFEDGRGFGEYYTWIKWAEPSAEALRQACLARQSRISQSEPHLPQISITKLDVTNSKFLSSFSIEFNAQYNALIGGRGTGKSTILEYLRWGLCDQIVSTSDPEEMTELERRRKKLVDNTLANFDGEVRISFSLNGINHIIKKNSVTKETNLKIGNADFQTVTEEEVRKILPIQAYSQKQLSSVGVSTEELKRFIQIPIANELAALDFVLVDIVKSTKDEYRNLLRQREIQVENEQFGLEIASLSNQVLNLRRSLTGMSEGDQAIITKKPGYDDESNIVTNFRRELNSRFSKIVDLQTAIHVSSEPLQPSLQTENVDLINSISNAVEEKFAEVNAKIDQLRQLFTPENTVEINTLINQWRLIKNQFDADYELAMSRSTSNQQQLIEIQRIESRLTLLQNNITERQIKLREMGSPQVSFESLRNQYWDIHRQKAFLLKAQATRFSDLSKKLIRVEIEKNIDVALIKFELNRVLVGTRINSDKMQAICDLISVSENPLSKWNEILKELQSLSELTISESGSIVQLSQCPNLVECGLNEGNQRRIAEVLSPENWLNLATLKIEFAPDFKYTTNTQMEDVIPFAEASAGQQATALLTVLLNQPGTPLLIDQPEDDIDNKAIDEIIQNIWDAKKYRQLIFTSHNANLVVNGDAELVVCCDYREAGNQTRGGVKEQGAIDSKAVKNEITSVMEGGEKAFKLRKEKYGF